MIEPHQLVAWIGSDDFLHELTRLEGIEPTPKLLLRLRRTMPRARAELLYEVATAWRQASDKFECDFPILATRRALEQSTAAPIARWKAARFSGQTRVIDFCCGIGGDALAIARTSESVLGVDSAPIVAAMLKQNAHRCHLPNLESCAAMCQSLRPKAATAWHLDPDRRTGRQRTIDPARMQPPASWIAQLLERAPTGAIKLAPATRLPPTWRSGRESTWVSHLGECKQLVLWSGEFVRHPDKKVAVRISREGHASEWVEGDSSPQRLPVARDVGAFLYELDPALLAAELGHDFAARHGLAPLTQRAAYCTAGSSGPVRSPWVRAFRVQTVLPLRPRTIARWAKEQGVSISEIKHRAVSLDAIRSLAPVSRTLPSGSPRTLVATRIGGRHVAVIAERISAAE